MKRNHPLSILYFKFNVQVIVNFVLYLFTLNIALSAIFDSLDVTMVGLGALAVLLLLVILIGFRAWLWYRTSYSYDENTLMYTKVTKLRVKEITLKSNKIASITRNQSLILRILSIYQVSVTTDTSAGDKNDSIDLFLSEADANAIIDNFDQEKPVSPFVAEADGTQSTAVAPSEAIVYKHTIGEMLIFPIIDQPNVYILFFAYIGAVFIWGIEGIEAGPTVAIIPVLLFVFGMVSPYINSFINGANLTLTFRENQDNLDLENGLLARKQNRFSKQNIRIFEYKYSRIIKRAHAKVGVVGTGDKEQTGEYQALTLYVNKEKVEMLQSACGFETGELEYFRPHKISLIYSVIGIIITVAIMITATALAKVFISDLLVLPKFIYPLTMVIIVVFGLFLLITSYFNYKHSKYFAMNDEYIVISDGYLNQQVDIFKYDNIQAFTQSCGPIARRIGTADLYLDLFDVGKFKDHSAKNYQAQDIEIIMEKIKEKISGEQ